MITDQSFLLNIHINSDMAKYDEGDEVIMCYLNKAFEPFFVDYDETIIIHPILTEYYIKKLTPGIAKVVET
jgi:hypothetical protein